MLDRKTIIKGLLWKLLERGGTQGIQFIVQIVLARLLLPEMYGTVALVTVFINLAQVFVQSGLGTALIQKKNADNVDFSSVFIVSLGLAAVLYVFLYVFAPVIAGFYRNTELIPVLRVLGLVLFFGAVNGIQNAWVSRNMLFKTLFRSSLGALAISGTAGIFAAYTGLGVWALVIQQLVNQACITVIMWFTVKWRPMRAFSLQRVKALFSFGYKLLISALIDTMYREMRTLVIGRMFTSSLLGFYNRGEQFPKLIMSNIDGSIQAVMLPALSAHQDDRQRVKTMMRRAIKTSSFIMFPMMVGMAVVAEPMVRLLLTEKWLPAVPFLRVFCFTYMLWPIHTANLQAINALGRSDIFLKLEIIKKVVGLLILVISVPMGVYAIALGGVAAGIISSIINAWPNRKLLNYSYVEQMMDIFPAFGLSVLMGVMVFLIGTLPVADWQRLILQLSLGGVGYLIMAKLTHNESMGYLIVVLKTIFIRKA